LVDGGLMRGGRLGEKRHAMQVVVFGVLSPSLFSLVAPSRSCEAASITHRKGLIDFRRWELAL
jgi:hypothetical protein